MLGHCGILFQNPFHSMSHLPQSHTQFFLTSWISCICGRKTQLILRSNDRPEISLVVRGLKFPASSFRDLEFLIPDGAGEGDLIPDKFLVFFDSRKEAEAAVKFLRKRLPQNLSSKICWFHSELMEKGREALTEKMRRGDVWGFCCSDSFGMVSIEHQNICIKIKF